MIDSPGPYPGQPVSQQPPCEWRAGGFRRGGLSTWVCTSWRLHRASGPSEGAPRAWCSLPQTADSVQTGVSQEGLADAYRRKQIVAIFDDFQKSITLLGL